MVQSLWAFWLVAQTFSVTQSFFTKLVEIFVYIIGARITFFIGVTDDKIKIYEPIHQMVKIRYLVKL